MSGIEIIGTISAVIGIIDECVNIYKFLMLIKLFIYISRNPDLITAVLNSWSVLAKQRPSQTQIIVSALTSWTPAALSHLSAFSVKSVEKAVRILLMHLHRYLLQFIM